MTDASITELTGIGTKRAKHCSAESVEDLAEMPAQKVYNELAQTGMSPEQVEAVVDEARELADVDGEATVYTEGPSDEFAENSGVEVPTKSMSTDNDTTDVESFTNTEPETTDVDGFTTDEPSRPDVVGNVLLIGGDGAFDDDGGRHGELSADEQAQLIAKRLVEFDIDLEDAEALSAMDRGAGKVAVDSFIKQTDGEALPELVKPFEPNFDAFDGYAEAYEDCRERALEWADTLVVFANGDYVGMWVSMALDRNVRIESPDVEE